MELWNSRHLDPPANTCCKAPMREADVKAFDAILRSSITFFQNQKQLHTEASILSRLIYRMKLKFRSSKDFKFVEKLNRALLVYLRVDILSDLRRLWEMIPEDYEAGEVYMPSRNMLDYVLVRLQGLGKIFERIMCTCCLSATYQQKGLKLGHFWKVVVIVYALISRIYVIAGNILKHICDLYSSLHPFSYKLRNPGVQWLPVNYQFPQSLADWLHIDKLDLDTSVIDITDDETFASFFNIEDSEDEVEISDEYVLIDDAEKTYRDGNLGDLISLLTPLREERCESKIDDSIICLTSPQLKHIDIGEVITSDKKSCKRKWNEITTPKFKRDSRVLFKSDSGSKKSAKKMKLTNQKPLPGSGKKNKQKKPGLKQRNHNQTALSNTPRSRQDQHPSNKKKLEKSPKVPKQKKRILESSQNIVKSPISLNFVSEPASSRKRKKRKRKNVNMKNKN